MTVSHRDDYNRTIPQSEFNPGTNERRCFHGIFQGLRSGQTREFRSKDTRLLRLHRYVMYSHAWPMEQTPGPSRPQSFERSQSLRKPRPVVFDGKCNIGDSVTCSLLLCPFKAMHLNTPLSSPFPISFPLSYPCSQLRPSSPVRSCTLFL
jgi:hypothetical protein